MEDILVSSLGLSVRATNALNKMQIYTLEQLLDTTIERIRDGKNIGEKTLVEIDDFCKNYRENGLEANFLIQEKAVQIRKERTYSEDELEEMSCHNITELELSTRAENGLMRISCDTMEKLATVSEIDLRNMKGMGAKTCDEILHKREMWIEKNLFSIDSEKKGLCISDMERNFYKRLAQVLDPISRILWKQLREMLLQNGIMQEDDDFSLDRIDDDFIYCVICMEEYDALLRSYFSKITYDEIIRIDDLRTIIAAENFEFDIAILMERFLDGKLCKKANDIIYLPKMNIKQYMKGNENPFKQRESELFIRRLNGETLQEMGDEFGLSRERVRQILARTAKKTPYLFEDYYRFPYMYFKLSKEEFCSAFPECGAVGYEYLFLKYKKGNEPVNNGTVESYAGHFKDRMAQYLREENLRQDKKHVTRNEMICRVLMSNSDRAMTMEEFEMEYYAYIERRNYPLDRLAINIHTATNYMRNSSHIVFNKDNRLRYCEADPSKIWDSIDFNQYRDMVISSELIYKDYIDLMEELDIRDGYELFYIIKSSLENWDNTEFDISCRRVPVMVIGNGDETAQALQLLKEISPIDYYGYYEAYEERYGVRNAYGNVTITGVLSNYYIDGVYSADIVALDEEDAIALKHVLCQKNFWFIDEVEKIFQETCVNSSRDALNKASLRRIGYSLKIGYLYNADYGAVVNYFDREIFSQEIIDLNGFDRRLLRLSAFGSAMYKKQMDLEYIEVAPKVYMTLRELERHYGLTLDDIYRLQEWANQCEDKYFNAHSVWREIKNMGYDAKLQNNEWLCTCIFRQQSSISSQPVAGGIILCKNSKELSLGAVCQWIVENNGKLTVQDLTTKFNEIFATKIPVSKIAEKLKAFGLWEKLVTDSLDEYIDNLVATKETDIDVDELLQEEYR